MGRGALARSPSLGFAPTPPPGVPASPPAVAAVALGRRPPPSGGGDDSGLYRAGRWRSRKRPTSGCRGVLNCLDPTEKQVPLIGDLQRGPLRSVSVSTSVEWSWDLVSQVCVRGWRWPGAQLQTKAREHCSVVEACLTCLKPRAPSPPPSKTVRVATAPRIEALATKPGNLGWICKIHAVEGDRLPQDGLRPPLEGGGHVATHPTPLAH